MNGGRRPPVDDDRRRGPRARPVPRHAPPGRGRQGCRPPRRCSRRRRRQPGNGGVGNELRLAVRLSRWPRVVVMVSAVPDPSADTWSNWSSLFLLTRSTTLTASEWVRVPVAPSATQAASACRTTTPSGACRRNRTHTARPGRGRSVDLPLQLARTSLATRRSVSSRSARGVVGQPRVPVVQEGYRTTVEHRNVSPTGPVTGHDLAQPDHIDGHSWTCCSVGPPTSSPAKFGWELGVTPRVLQITPGFIRPSSAGGHWGDDHLARSQAPGRRKGRGRRGGPCRSGPRCWPCPPPDMRRSRRALSALAASTR